MSLDEINHLMARAYDNLSDAQFLFEHKRYKGIPNRSYYAIFDALNALLRIHETYTKTHKGAQIKYSEFFIKTQLMPEESVGWLNTAFNLRQATDYDFSFEVTEEEAAESIACAREFLLHVEAYLKAQNLV